MTTLRLAAQSPKLPPFSVESEQSVLGAMILDNGCIPDVTETLLPDDFYREDHQTIFKAVVDLHSKRRPADFVTVTEHLREDGELENAGGLAYLGSLANDTPSAANVLAYAEIVKERAALRKLIDIGDTIAGLGYRPEGRSGTELLGIAQSALLKLNPKARHKPKQIAEYLDEFEADLARRAAAGTSGLSTGFGQLDQAWGGGMEAGDLIILAGRPGMCKTIMALHIAYNVASRIKGDDGPPGCVLGFSIEMPGKQWVGRLCASLGDIDAHRLRDPKLMDDKDHDGMLRARQRLESIPLVVDESTGITAPDIRSKALRIHAKYPIQLVVIDYVQLIETERQRRDENRTQEMDAISRSLKALAKDLNCPVLALAALNRKVEERDNKRPRMSDIRESGGIESDADVVCGLYRDEYYHKGSAHRGILECINLKARSADPGAVAELQFVGARQRIEDYFGPSSKERVSATKEAPKEAGGLKKPKKKPGEYGGHRE